MEINYLRVNEIVDSISETHSFKKDKLYAVNTSDILEGEFLSPQFLNVDELKGQFKKTIKKNDILFSEIRPANKRYAKVDFEKTEDYVVSTKLMVLRKFNDKVDLDYFYYWLTSSSFLQTLQSRAENRICSFPQITFELLSDFYIPVPEMSIQKKIAAILKNLDTKIKTNNKINAELESMAKTLYDYWFLQFEFPNEEGKPYKSSGGKMVWNEELKREIPDGWEVKKLVECIAKSKNGDWGNEKPKESSDIKVRCFRGADFSSITTDYKLTAPVRYISSKNSNRLLSDGDLVTEISGGSPTQATGRIGYINQKFLDRSSESMICSNFCKAFSPISKDYQFWLYQTWRVFYDAGAMFNYEGKTTGIKNLMFDDFIKSIKIPVPNEKLLKRYQKVASSCYNKTQDGLKESEQFAALRDFLLPLLMNGQVKIG